MEMKQFYAIVQRTQSCVYQEQERGYHVEVSLIKFLFSALNNNFIRKHTVNFYKNKSGF